MYIGHIHTTFLLSNSSQIHPHFPIHPTQYPLLSFFNYPSNPIVVSEWASVWGYSLEHDQPSRGHVFKKKKNLAFPSPEAITSISGEFMVRPLSMLDCWMAWSFAGHLSCGEFKSCYVQKTLTHSSNPWPLALICLPPMMALDPGEMDDVVGSYMIQMSHLWLSSTVHLFSALWTVIIFYVNYHPPHQETSLRRSESFIYNIWV